MAFGNGSMTVPSTSMASSLAMVLHNLLSNFLLAAVLCDESSNGFVVHGPRLQFDTVDDQMSDVLALGTVELAHQTIGYGHMLIIIELNHHILSSRVSSLS